MQCKQQSGKKCECVLMCPRTVRQLVFMSISIFSAVSLTQLDENVNRINVDNVICLQYFVKCAYYANKYTDIPSGVCLHAVL